MIYGNSCNEIDLNKSLNSAGILPIPSQFRNVYGVHCMYLEIYNYSNDVSYQLFMKLTSTRNISKTRFPGFLFSTT
jgi:hypothetical protein